VSAPVRCAHGLHTALPLPRPPVRAELEDGWTRIKAEGIDHLERLLDSGFNKQVQPFSHVVTVRLYNMCYHMCTQRAPKNWSEQMYARHGEAIRVYLRNKVLPALRHKRGDFLLLEMVTRWDQHKIMNRCVA